MNYFLPFSLGLLFLAGVFAVMFLGGARRSLAAWLSIVPAFLFAVFLYLTETVINLGPIEFKAAWVAGLDVDFILRLDGLALLFALLITGIGSLIVLYASGYMADDRGLNRLLAFLLMFMGAMLGVVLSDNLILLFVFWELTSVSSYLLIGFKHEYKESRWKALQALLVTGAGGLCLLGGFILLGIVGGTFQLSELLQRGEIVLESDWLVPIVVLILLGAFTKSAQFPFHFWLPNAMAAPTPVSAYLHSATMVKAGVFLLARFNPLLGDVLLWEVALLVTGTFTMLYAAGRGLFETDLKRILAFTTLGVLGGLVMLLGVGTDLAIKSAMLFLFGHALYKASLFMVAGNVDYATGTRDVRRLAGLRKIMPFTMVAAALAALSKAGFPPFVGFLGKEYVYKTGLAVENLDTILVSAAFLANVVFMALAFKVGLHPFWHKANDESGLDQVNLSDAHEVPKSMWFGPLVLAFSGLLFGLLPGLLATPLISAASGAVAGEAFQVRIELWQGFKLPLYISALTLIVGYLLYRGRFLIWRNPSSGDWLRRLDTEVLYNGIYAGFVKASKWQTQVLQNGSLRNYLLVIIGSTTLILLVKLVDLGTESLVGLGSAISFFEVALSLVMVCSALLAVTTRSRMNALVSLGVVGLGVALIFAIYGAPDLALTQILVETMTVALFMFVVYYLPPFRRFSSKSARWVDAAFSAVFGFVMVWLILKSMSLQFSPPISEQLVEWSYPLAKGRNVVNVILVDFRAMDTFGEIVVLAIAALGVWLCLDVSQKTESSAGIGTPVESDIKPSSLLLSIGAKCLLPVFLFIALVALYRGHNDPGGGFIGGLLAASGFILLSLADGVPVARRVLRISPKGLMALGLVVALLSSLLGPIAGVGFFEGLWLPSFSIPVLGAIHLGTPLLFDVGVFLTVVGFALQVAFSLEQIRVVSRSAED